MCITWCNKVLKTFFWTSEFDLFIKIFNLYEPFTLNTYKIFRYQSYWRLNSSGLTLNSLPALLIAERHSSFLLFARGPPTNAHQCAIIAIKTHIYARPTAPSSHGWVCVCLRRRMRRVRKRESEILGCCVDAVASTSTWACRCGCDCGCGGDIQCVRGRGLWAILIGSAAGSVSRSRHGWRAATIVFGERARFSRSKPFPTDTLRPDTLEQKGHRKI